MEALYRNEDIENENSMFQQQQLVYSVRQAAEVLGVSTGLVYAELKRNNQFPRKLIGGRIVIPVKKLREYMES